MTYTSTKLFSHTSAKTSRNLHRKTTSTVSYNSHTCTYTYNCLRWECLFKQVERCLLLVVPDKVGVWSHQIVDRLKDRWCRWCVSSQIVDHATESANSCQVLGQSEFLIAFQGSVSSRLLWRSVPDTWLMTHENSIWFCSDAPHRRRCGPGLSSNVCRAALRWQHEPR